MSEEKIVIGEIDLDMDQILKDTKALKEEVGLLTAQYKKAQKETGDLSDETITYEASLKSAKNQLRTQETMLSKVIDAEKEEKNSLEKLKAQLYVVSKQWSAVTKVESENSDTAKKLAEQKLALTEAIKKEEMATGSAGRNVGFYDKAANRATGTIKQMGGQLLAATGLTLGLSGALKGAEKAIMSTQVSGDKFEATMGAMKAATSEFFKSIATGNLSGLGKRLKEAAAAGKAYVQALDDIGDRVRATNVLEAKKEEIVSNQELILKDTTKSYKERAAAGKKILEEENKFAKDNLDLSQKKYEAERNNLISIMKGVDANKLGAETMAEYEKELQNFIQNYSKDTELREKATQYIKEEEDAIRKLTSAQQQANSAAESGMSRNYIKYQVEKEKEAQKALDEFYKNADSNVKNYAAVFKEYGERTVDAELDKFTNGWIGLINTQTQYHKDISENQIQFNSIMKELNAESNKPTETGTSKPDNSEVEEKRKQALEAVELMEYELQMWELTNQSKLDSSKQLSKELIAAEKDRINEQQAKEKELLDAKLDNKLITIQQYNIQAQTLENQTNESINALSIQYQQEQNNAKATLLIDQYNTKKESVFAQLNAAKQALEEEKKAQIANAKKTGASTEKIEKRYAAASKTIEEAKQEATLGVAAETAGNLATIFGETTAAGKAAAVAQATISTYLAANQAYSAMSGIPYVGPVLGAIAAAAAVASGIANVKKILSVSTDGSSSGSSSSSSGSSSSTTITSSSSSLSSVSTDVGNGIVSRSTDSSESTTSDVSTVLVVDDVTEAQKSESRKVSASTI